MRAASMVAFEPPFSRYQCDELTVIARCRSTAVNAVHATLAAPRERKYRLRSMPSNSAKVGQARRRDRNPSTQLPES